MKRHQQQWNQYRNKHNIDTYSRTKYVVVCCRMWAGNSHHRLNIPSTQHHRKFSGITNWRELVGQQYFVLWMAQEDAQIPLSNFSALVRKLSANRRVWFLCTTSPGEFVIPEILRYYRKIKQAKCFSELVVWVLRKIGELDRCGRIFGVGPVFAGSGSCMTYLQWLPW